MADTATGTGLAVLSELHMSWFEDRAIPWGSWKPIYEDTA
jgi:hypothetical protein